MSSKRLMDLAAGSLLAVFAAPLIAVLAVLALCHYRAWPFFTQERIGAGGRPFKFVKVRTLMPGTPSYELKCVSGHAAPSRLMQCVRNLHLDELPQLFLVLRGRMSLVGPRPKMPDRYEPAEASYVATRLQVAQGCTGLWQIGAHRDGLPNEAPEYDLFYVAHANVRLDVWILWHTLRQMVGLGALVHLTDVPGWARRSSPAKRTVGRTVGGVPVARPRVHEASPRIGARF